MAPNGLWLEPRFPVGSMARDPKDLVRITVLVHPRDADPEDDEDISRYLWETISEEVEIDGRMLRERLKLIKDSEIWINDQCRRLWDFKKLMLDTRTKESFT